MRHHKRCDRVVQKVDYFATAECYRSPQPACIFNLPKRDISRPKSASRCGRIWQAHHPSAPISSLLAAPYRPFAVPSDPSLKLMAVCAPLDGTEGERVNGEAAGRRDIIPEAERAMQRRQSLPPPSFFAHSILLLSLASLVFLKSFLLFASNERARSGLFLRREGCKERGDAEKGGWRDFWN